MELIQDVFPLQGLPCMGILYTVLNEKFNRISTDTLYAQ